MQLNFIDNQRFTSENHLAELPQLNTRLHIETNPVTTTMSASDCTDIRLDQGLDGAKSSI